MLVPCDFNNHIPTHTSRLHPVVKVWMLQLTTESPANNDTLQMHTGRLFCMRQLATIIDCISHDRCMDPGPGARAVPDGLRM